VKKTIILILLLAASSAYSQSYPGCGANDLKCLGDAALKAMQANPKDPENYYNLALVFQRNGSHKEAVEAFGMYIAIPGVKPEYLADGYNNRGVSHRKLGRADLALADYSKAFELVPTEPKFVANRGNANTDLKKYDAALADYAAALKLNPQFAPAYSGRANLHGQRRNFNEAVADFTKAIEYSPDDPENYYNRAVMYREMRELDKAIADYDKYIPMMAGNPVYQADGYINLGIAKAMLGRREEAVADFTKVIELDPKRPNGYRARAVMYRELKKDDLAAADEKKAAELK